MISIVINLAIAMAICSKCGTEYVERFQKALAYAMGNGTFRNGLTLPGGARIWIEGRDVLLPTSKKHVSKVFTVRVDGYAYDGRDVYDVLGKACPVFNLIPQMEKEHNEQKIINEKARIARLEAWLGKVNTEAEGLKDRSLDANRRVAVIIEKLLCNAERWLYAPTIHKA